MKSWGIQQHGSFEGLELIDQPEPRPGAGEVLVRIRAVSLNYRDLITVRIANPGNLPPPLVPCSDGAGEVVSVGEGVTQWQPGDRVAGIFFRDWISGPFAMDYHKAALGGSVHGMLREQAVLPEHALVRIPEHLSFEEAACLPCAGVTAWYSLFERGGLRAGETVLALGTGGVSILALQLAHAAGAQVIITSSSDEKLQRARELGAWGVVNYRSTPDWDKEVWKLTEKQGVDHVVEVGGPGTLGKSINAIAAGGRIGLIGVLTGFGAPDTSLFPLVARNAQLNGIYVGPRSAFEALNAFLAEHRLRPVVDRVFPFTQAPEAFEYMASAAHFGKVAIALG